MLFFSDLNPESFKYFSSFNITSVYQHYVLDFSLSDQDVIIGFYDCKNDNNSFLLLEFYLLPNCTITNANFMQKNEWCDV